MPWQGSDKITSFSQNSTFKAKKDEIRTNLSPPGPEWKGNTHPGKDPKGKDDKSRLPASVRADDADDEFARTPRGAERPAGSSRTTAWPRRRARLGPEPQLRALLEGVRDVRWRSRSRRPLQLHIPDSLVMNTREVGGKAKASSPLSNAAKNAKVTEMEVDEAAPTTAKANQPDRPSGSVPKKGGAPVKGKGGEKSKGGGQATGNGGGNAAKKGGGSAVPKGGGNTSQKGGAQANQNGGGHRPRKPKKKPKPGDPGWEAFRIKRNKRRAEQQRLKKKNGRRCPFALYIDASGVTAEASKRIPISLVEWKSLLQQAIVQMAEDLLEMKEEGVESPGDRLYLAHQCFVEHVPKDAEQGVPTSSKPDDQRFGHGAMFFDTEEAQDFATRAFRGTSVVREGKKFEVALKEREIDRRACYTMVAQKVIWQVVCTYFWKCVSYAYKGLPPGEPEVVKEKATDRSDDYIVLVIRVDRLWERCLDDMDERLFKLPFGRYVLRKKSEGIWPKPQILPPDREEEEAEEEAETGATAPDEASGEQ